MSVEPSPAPPPVSTQWKRWTLLGGLAFLLLAAIAWWTYHSAAERAKKEAMLGALNERQKALTDELNAIKPPEKPICKPAETLQEIKGGMQGASAGAPALPPDVGSPPPSGATTTLSKQAIAQMLEKATAIVLTENGTGTGFFVAPNMLITNRHVIESGGKIWLTSRSLGSIRPGTVMRATRSSDVGSPDFALIRMDSGTAPGTLGVTSQVVKLSDVVAAGFPGVVLKNDQNFARLLKGDFTAAPDLNLTQGVVQSLQAGPDGMPLIVHTAAISGGNSGGPLVDSCGRVIGVNTFISVDNEQSTKTGYAINAKVVDAFIRAAGESIAVDARQCRASN